MQTNKSYDSCSILSHRSSIRLDLSINHNFGFLSTCVQNLLDLLKNPASFTSSYCLQVAAQEGDCRSCPGAHFFRLDFRDQCNSNAPNLMLHRRNRCREIEEKSAKELVELGYQRRQQEAYLRNPKLLITSILSRIDT